MRHQIFATCSTLGEADLSTPEGRRAAGRATAQANGGAAAVAACSATGVGAAAAAVCGTVGANVAGRVYDYTERYGEQKAEQAYDWASSQVSAGWSKASSWLKGAGSDVASFFGVGGGGGESKPIPHFFSATDEGRLIVQLPTVPELLAASPSYRAPDSIARLPAHPSREQIMASDLGPGVEALMRHIMGDWNAMITQAVRDVRNASPIGTFDAGFRQLIQALEGDLYDIDAVVEGRGEKPPTPMHPYNFDGPYGAAAGVRAGTPRNAIASFVLLQKIAAAAAKEGEKPHIDFWGGSGAVKAVQKLVADQKKPAEDASVAPPATSSKGPWLLALLGLGGVAGAAYWYKKRRRGLQKAKGPLNKKTFCPTSGSLRGS